MAPTRAIWQPHQVPSKILRSEDDREGRLHTQVFDRYSRYEPQVAKGLTQMFVAGVSTQKVGEVTQTLMGVAESRKRDQPSPSKLD